MPSRMDLLGRWKRWREERALQRRAIDDDLWAQTLAQHPFLARRSPQDLDELRRMSSLFLDRKEFAGADDFVVSDDVAVAVAAQACLPVLRLGLSCYDGFVGIVMHANEVRAKRSVTDELGLVHEYEEVLAGEAMEGGPIMLSWEDASGRVASPDGGQATAYNVVIHEFAHVLDLRDGAADGVPGPMDTTSRQRWLSVMQPAYDDFRERVVCGHEFMLDPYGASSIDEFFAVVSESFFVTPEACRDERPRLYALLAEYYRQDPAEGR